MELRQLRYFVAVAEELHFGRAAERLHISAPALSQQVIALERDVGVELLIRDRRGVRLTAAGRTLLDDARHIVGLAESARDRVRQTATLSAPLRLGYVSWLPNDVAAVVGPTVPVRVDEWVLPSHSQADRVAEGTLDLAVTWIGATAAARRKLDAHLLFAEPLRAVVPGTTSDEPVSAQNVTVLVDADESAWSSWNRFVEEFATHTGARVRRIDDGGITGEAFFGHVRKARAAVLASPKRHTAAIPPTLGVRPVDPVPMWTWSLVHRADDDRPAVAHVVRALREHARSAGWIVPPPPHWWVPSDDPHRAALAEAEIPRPRS
ncbi:LysR family transcriptional regulator [Mycolicibacterium madagascariense]|uniref:Probable hydrogen peroxide-inducible genes activator n=1 Tax=Mycolicibacterium madagascariense TaxID=212765 RepID=A0A7I7XH91_9MYCO|nr:LysR family transcriptional regulator [Mycolicibacterium madagascariense]MCV7014332.1 LysR family transcriptional regulator [Mycolicibacterium madagascariense]BBZ28577.1 LysR family transcriptional regulator [Mycolicibacterium madagascariense]